MVPVSLCQGPLNSTFYHPRPRPTPCSAPVSSLSTTGRRGASRRRRVGSGRSLPTSTSWFCSSRAACPCCLRNSTTTARYTTRAQHTNSAHAVRVHMHVTASGATPALALPGGGRGGDACTHYGLYLLWQVLALLRQRAGGAPPPNAVHRLGVG